MKSKQTNKLLLKLISLLFALIIWLVVVNIDDPEVTRSINGIPVNPLDVSVIADKNQVYSIVSGDTVDIQVTGPRSQVDNMTKEDFVAEAPFSEKSNVDAVPIYVTFRNSKYEKHCEINQKNMTMKLNVEDIIEKSYEIELLCTGTESAGYMIGKKTLSPSVVTVSAPASVINLISRVQVSMDVSGLSENHSEELPIQYYTETGSRITFGEGSSSNVKTANAALEIYSIKEVPIKFGYTGNVAEGYELISLDCSRQTVKIAGPDVAQIDDITLPNELLNVTDATQDVVASVDIAAHIPKGTMLLTTVEEPIQLTAKIGALIQRDYNIPISEIDIRNLSEEYQAEFTESSISIRFSGLMPAHDSLQLGALNAYVDLRNVREGVNEVIVKITIPENMKVVSDIRAHVMITRIPEETSETTTPDATTTENETTTEEETTEEKRKPTPTTGKPNREATTVKRS